MAMVLTICLFTIPEGVSAASKTPSLKDTKMTLNVGQSKSIVVKNKTKGVKITYESNRPKIATVSKKGKVKGKSEGKANIYVYVGGSKRLICYVTVKPAPFAKKTVTHTVEGGMRAALFLTTEEAGVPIEVTVRAENENVALIAGVYDSVDLRGTDLDPTNNSVTIQWTSQKWIAVENYTEYPMEVTFEIKTKDGKKTITKYEIKDSQIPK